MSKNEIRVKFQKKEDLSYSIHLVDDFLGIARKINEVMQGRRPAVITDSNVKRLYLKDFVKAMQSEGISGDIFTIQPGETNKTMSNCLKIINEMQNKGFGRDSIIIALGGGVVGDMSGFIASIYMRGIPIIQIPTTLLAMADSSVGGKTGVDTEYGKNLVGAFKQPKAVLINPGFCKSLSGPDMLNGMAETIKHSIIMDSGLFDFIKNNKEEIIEKRSPAALRHIIYNNCRIKSEIVIKDPKEQGIRKILNFGHTVGHAIEHLSNYMVSHGEAVSIGIVVESRIANAIHMLKDNHMNEIIDLLDLYGLPVSVPGIIKPSEIIGATSMDKKAKEGIARYCLPKSIGSISSFSGEYVTEVSKEIVETAIGESR